MNQIVLAAFVVVAAAVAGAAPGEDTLPLQYPKYHEAAGHYRTALKVVNNVMPPSGDLSYNSTSYHFGLFVATLFDLVETLGDPDNKLSYDEYYFRGLLNGVVTGLELPLFVVNKFYAVAAKVENTLQPVMDLVKLLGSTDKSVEEQVKANPALQIPANLLLEAGKFAEMYLQHTFEKEAIAHTVVSSLVKGKESLKPLISHAVSVFPYTGTNRH